MEYLRLRGIGVSPGIAIGEVQIKRKLVFTSRIEKIAFSQVEEELGRLSQALDRTREQLIHIKEEIEKKLGQEHSFIFESHLLILEDRSLLSSIREAIQKKPVTAECAISLVHDKYVKIFESLTDEYFRQRKSDVTDVLSKLYKNLKPVEKLEADDGPEKILVAHDLLPSEAASRLSQGNVLAVALDMGGTTSHTAILARSWNIPAVMGLSNITQKVKSGDRLIVDGTDGEVIINPPMAIKREFISKRKKYEDYREELKKTAKLKANTLDDVRFFPLANIELPEEVKPALSLGAEGIGLFRSEFIFFKSTTLPDEEDHYRVYLQVARDAYPLPVYIRTVDIGGEKNLPQMKIEKEPNPALGLRAIRFSLRDRELFKIQLRAILRASVQKNVHLLIPMITELEEIDEVKRLLDEVKIELSERGNKFDENIPLGIMIEVPAAAAMADQIIKEVDYISVGTNDLIQYYLAVDRSNELVSYLFKPLHPSVLRALRFIIESAQQEGKEVTVCGEMAADPLSAIVLLGLGLRHFSMNPIFIPKIKGALRSVEFRTAEEIVHQALTLNTTQEIEELILERVLFKHPKALLVGEVTTS